MWICKNNSFLSIVQPSPADPLANNGLVLLVRARVKGHIEATFPNADVKVVPGRDYLYRAYIARETVADAIADSLRSIDYGNFKNSVGDNALHDAYAKVWHAMGRLQPGGPYGRGA